MTKKNNPETSARPGKASPHPRDLSFDIMRGAGILMMVYAHTLPWCRNFLYIITLQLFLLESGYFQPAGIGSVREWSSYMRRRVKGLYVPCAVCNGVYVLLTRLFLRLGIYTDDPAFLEMTQGWPVPQKLHIVNGAGDILRRFLRVLLMTDTTQLGTATWFLITLFGISLLYSIFLLLSRGCTERTKGLLLAVFFLLAVIPVQFVSSDGTLQRYLKCTCACFIAFFCGVWIRRMRLKDFKGPAAAAAFCLLLLLSHYYKIDIAQGNIGNVPVYLAATLAGWVLMRYLSSKIVKVPVLSGILNYFGEHTLPVLCMHILCFKIVSRIYIITHDLPAVYLASFHCMFFVNDWWKLLYLAVGSVVPILIYAVWKKTFHAVMRQAAQ